ncbi:D-alanyl-D-alanine carboxypeptidase family protein [uncultured Jatrophihabitans sp.]|uniref:D-alanyl-D-alanine carboxypeptidase family protein n=1 Tax=uncultured Jatrophihabitans sp. TaxID=1610747 RepID=UPI0035CA8459
MAVASPAPTPSSSPAAHSVPPAAPRPTDHGNSPEAPDPHPPRGGLGPQGQAVGGTALLTRGTVLPAGSPTLPRDITARAWVVADLDTGAVVAARDPHGRYQPASIQKILTAVTLLPLLPGTRRVTVSRSAADTEGSHAGLVAGGSYTVDQIFEGLLLVSGNDAAEALAQAAGGRAHTVGLMNTEARTLGAYDTLVQTPSGLDGWQQLTSAYDMMLFLRAASAQPRFVAYDRTRSLVLPKQKRVGAVRLVNQNLDFLDEIPGAVAAKTGYTDAAQHTFAGVITDRGQRYGVVLMRAQRYPQDQYVQAARLVRWAAALPHGTAPVGRLESPPQVRPAAATSGTATRSGTPSSPAPSPSAATGKGSGGDGVKVLVAVLLFGAFLYSTRRLRGLRGPPRRRRGPGPR